MALSSGARLGPYEIIAPLGAGGMGEVYRATDTNLKRAVAIKVLPESVAADAERLARFQREAEVLAALNHPHIAAIYGLERSDVSTALVMELVEGPTLADCIGQGAMPVEETIAIARQIAEALEAAHGQGIVHRDLKPANIKVRSDGAVKVLDFGLAKATGAGWARGRQGAPTAPTITSPAMMTANGVLLGTVAYMSPEQARGKAVDKRSDIWAFGAVVYEMLTGRRAFPGEEIADVLAAVLTREPDWTLLPAGLPPGVATLLRRCLHKDRTQRIRDIGDAWLALDGAFDGTGPPARAVRRVRPANLETDASVRRHGHRRWTRHGPRRMDLLAADSGTSSDAPLRLRAARRPGAPEHAAASHCGLPRRQLLRLSDERRVAIGVRSATWRRVSSPGQRRLRHRFARWPWVVIPVGQWLAYFSGSGQLKKVAIAGGASMDLCAATLPFGASWTRDNTILFGQTGGIMRVSADGGTPETDRSGQKRRTDLRRRSCCLAVAPCCSAPPASPGRIVGTRRRSSSRNCPRTSEPSS